MDSDMWKAGAAGAVIAALVVFAGFGVMAAVSGSGGMSGMGMGGMEGMGMGGMMEDMDEMHELCKRHMEEHHGKLDPGEQEPG